MANTVWTAMAQQWLAAPPSHCSVRLNGDIKESLNGHIEINWDGTCTQEEGLHLRWREARRRGLCAWRRWRRRDWAAGTYVRVGKGGKIELI